MPSISSNNHVTATFEGVGDEIIKDTAIEGVGNNDSTEGVADNINPDPNNDNDDSNVDIVDTPHLYQTNGRPIHMRESYVKDKNDGNEYAYITIAKIYGIDKDTLTADDAFLHV